MNSKRAFEELRLSQMDLRLTALKAADLPRPPKVGWIKSIRTAMGMTATSLSRRLHITTEGVRQIEKAEAEQRITMTTLVKVADALNCDVHYVLIPRIPLTQQLNNRARELARQHMKAVSHTTALEDQKLDEKSEQIQLDVLAMSFLNGPRRDFW